MHGFKHTPARSLSSQHAARNRQAFTLVELLVVIVIIGILMALLVPAVGGALNAANNARMGIEVASLAQAVEAYRTQYQAYPPDFALNSNPDKAQIDAHLARNFRWRNPNDTTALGDLRILDPSEALVFWLSGFSGDEKLPLSGRKQISPEWKAVKGQKPFFEFDQTRLDDKDGDGYPEYYPEGSEMPYVYLMHENYGKKNGELFTANEARILNDNVRIRAYAAELQGTAVKRFAEAEKFQIICAGQDGAYGASGSLGAGLAALFPDGAGYVEEDEDNITNFSEGKTLEAAIP